MTTISDTTNANSLGHQLSHAAQLDGHFLKCQVEYEAMVRAVGIQPGWHVLDAGCGTGVFLPLLADLVGPTGKVTAIDVAPENRQSAQALVDTLQIDGDIRIQAGNVTGLPFADNTFDAIWCANVSQYLTDEQFTNTLQEMRRVVKPSGLVAIKEFDATTWQFLPADPKLMIRLIGSQKAPGPLHTQDQGCLRPPLFRTWFQSAGFHDIWLKNFVSECQPPLTDELKVYLQNLLLWLAEKAETADISQSDLDAWRQMSNMETDHILNRPDFYNRESHILAVGKKPE